MNILRWLLSNQLKCSQKQKKNGGFTLIELLVATILAILILTPLLGFMVNILDTDRKEQAKATSEQEIKAAIDYIARDMQQALYIYDATGVAAITSQLPTVTGGSPVLVFWKREFYQGSLQFTGVPGADDSFVYSLVAYYLIQDNSSTWSNAARIARFQIRDGVSSTNGTTCPNAYDTTGKYSVCPDPGFQPFNLSQAGQTLQQKMNSWTAIKASYTQVPLVLVDFIDQTTTTNGAPTASCPTSFSTVPSNIQMTGFYACVNSVDSNNRSVAEIYLRGNALARLTNDVTRIAYNQYQLTYFPGVDVRVQGRSFIFTK